MKYLASYTGVVAIAVMTLTGCATPMSEDGMSDKLLTDRVYQIQNVSDRGVIDRSNITLRFGSDGQFSGSTGCNRVFGPYERMGGRIDFGALGVTKKACVPALMNQESDVLAILGAAETIEIDSNGALILKTDDGRFLRGFEQTAAMKVTTYRCADGTRLEASYPTTDTARVIYQGQTFDMTTTRSASGARYTGGGYEWWTKGTDEGYLAPLAPNEDTASASAQNCTAV